MPVLHFTTVPVQVFQPLIQSRVIIPDYLQVALEDIVVGHIETDHGRVQADICFRDIFSEKERPMAGLAKVFLQPVERFKEREEVRFVRFLVGSEPSLVHPVVDGVVDPVVHFVDLGL